MAQPVLRLQLLLPAHMLAKYLTDSFIPRDSSPCRHHSQGLKSTRRKPDIGLLTTRHTASIAEYNTPSPAAAPVLALGIRCPRGCVFEFESLTAHHGSDLGFYNFSSFTHLVGPDF